MIQGSNADVLVLDSASQVAGYRKYLLDSYMNTHCGVAPQLPPIKIPDVASESFKGAGLTATEMLAKMRSPAVRNLGDMLLDAFTHGHGLAEVSYDDVEKLTIEHMPRRGSGKQNLWNAFADWKTMPDRHSVASKMFELQSAQSTSNYGDDPLFEAMERHNKRMKLGREALRHMFQAPPLPTFGNHTNGPNKAKDWE